jgi:DNA-binding transcriptional LysR family regulator
MNDLPFSLDQLSILKAIAVQGNFKKAADSLYISQPAVSLQIQSLERQLNVQLLDRGGRRTTLTDAGHLLLRYSDRILALCDETCQALEDLQNLQTGTLVIGASQTTGTYLMPNLISLFRKKYPQIIVQLHVDSTRHICWNVANGQIDLAIIGGEVPIELRQTLQVIPYAEDELALIIPNNHPFAQKSEIKKEDLYQLNFIALYSTSTIRKLIENILSQHDINTDRFTIEMELNSIEAIKSAVQSELGAAFVSSSAITKELQLGLLYWAKIQDIQLNRKLYLVMNPNRYRSKAAEKFSFELLKNTKFVSQS